MQGGQIAKRERRAKGNARAGIGACHHRIHIVADGIEPIDRLTLLVNHLRVGGGDQPARGA